MAKAESEFKDITGLVQEEVQKELAKLTTRPTKDQLREHYWAGMGKDAGCLVCGSETISGGWTDYNGQVRCYCGTTYQVLGCHLKDEYLKEIGLAKEQIAKAYCDVFTIFPLCKVYTQEVGKPLPFGMYLGKSPITHEDRDSFFRWLTYNANRFRKEYEEDFNWDGLLQHYSQYANAGDGI